MDGQIPKLQIHLGRTRILFGSAGNDDSISAPNLNTFEDRQVDGEATESESDGGSNDGDGDNNYQPAAGM